MARVSLARQQLSDTGLTAAYSPAAEEGHKVENDGRVFLHVLNYSKEDITVTILSGYVKAGLKLADRVVEVGAGEEKFIGPFDTDVYNQTDGGKGHIYIPFDTDVYNQTDGGKGHIYIDYSATENVEVAALLFP